MLRTSRLCPLVKDGVFEVVAFEQLLQVQKIAVLAYSIESLVERGQTLLPVQNEEGVAVAIEWRCTLELACREGLLEGLGLGAGCQPGSYSRSRR